MLAAFTIVGVVVGGPSTAQAQTIDRSELQAELDAARLRWAENKPEVYEIRSNVGCSRICFGGLLWHNSIVSWSRVEPGRYVSSINESTGERAPGPSIEEIFSQIQTAIDNDWYGVSAKFDPVTGVPTGASFDPEPYKDESDEGFVSVLEVIDRTEPVPGAMDIAPLSTATSCLAGRGRVDVNLVNTAEQAARFQVEFEGLSPREYDVEPLALQRASFTGRRDGVYAITVLRDGEPFGNETVTVNCNNAFPESASPEVQVVNGCRSEEPAGGEIRFQFVNPTDTAKPYVIRFSGRPRSSTTAAPHGQAVRAVNGLKNGSHVARIYSGSTVVDQFIVNVDCPTS